MRKDRFDRLGKLLEKYKDKLVIDLETGTVTGVSTPIRSRYLQLGLWMDGEQYHYCVHEIIAFVGGLDLVDKTVNHINGNRLDNRLSNLEVLSMEDNRKHAYEKGLMASGEKNGTSVLTVEQVKEIRRLYEDGDWSYRKLGRKYDVSPTLIGKIVKREYWRGV